MGKFSFQLYLPGFEKISGHIQGLCKRRIDLCPEIDGSGIHCNAVTVILNLLESLLMHSRRQSRTVVKLQIPPEQL